MAAKRYLSVVGSLGLTSVCLLLSGCVIAPFGVRPYRPNGPYGAYPIRPVYVEPAPVVVVPVPGYFGYRGHWRGR